MEKFVLRSVCENDVTYFRNDPMCHINFGVGDFVEALEEATVVDKEGIDTLLHLSEAWGANIWHYSAQRVK